MTQTSDGVRAGYVMVTIQGVLFLAIALVPTVGPSWWGNTVLGVSVAAVGAVGVLVSGRFLGSALTPMPTPNAVGELARDGLYRWARHPMYTSLLVGALGVAMYRAQAVSYLLVLLLGLLFEVKSRFEEKFLLRKFPDYAAYAARTGKFVPWLGRRRVR